MKLQGEVLIRFADSKNGNKIYAPKGNVEVEEYTGKKKTFPHIFTADKERYEELEKKGLVGKGELVEEKKKIKVEEE